MVIGYHIYVKSIKSLSLLVVEQTHQHKHIHNYNSSKLIHNYPVLYTTSFKLVVVGRVASVLSRFMET